MPGTKQIVLDSLLMLHPLLTILSINIHTAFVRQNRAIELKSGKPFSSFADEVLLDLEFTDGAEEL